MAIDIFGHGLELLDDILSVSQTYVDDIALKFGTGGTVSIIYETADANANALLFVAPEGGGTDVPAFIFGDASVLNTDLGWFNGLTEPTIAVVNDAKDAYASLDAGDDGVAGSKGLYFKAAADEDIELINLSVTGTPRLFWDESESSFSLNAGLIITSGGLNGLIVTTTAGTLTIANDAAAALVTSGAYSITLTATAATNVTLPTTGTLATLAGTEELDNKTLDSSVLKGTLTASGTVTLPAVTLGGTLTLGSQQFSGQLSLNAGAANNIQCRISGAFTSGGVDTVACMIYVDASLTGAAGDTTWLAGTYLQNEITTQNNSETIGEVAQLLVYEPLITKGATDVITVAASIYIIGAPTEGATNAALYASSGDLIMASGVLKVGANQVVGAQQAAVADVSDGLLATTITQLNALLARVRTHGLIAT